MRKKERSDCGRSALFLVFSFGGSLSSQEENPPTNGLSFKKMQKIPQKREKSS